MFSDGAGEVPRWHCAVFDELLYRCWEHEYFLFNPYTGRTHVLNEFSWSILRSCAESARSESYLCSLLGSEMDPSDPAVTTGALDAHLCQLEQLGILVRAGDFGAETGL